MAYQRELTIRYCEKPGCSTHAQFQLVGCRNEPYGSFCQAHINHEVSRLHEVEEQVKTIREQQATPTEATRRGHAYLDLTNELKANQDRQRAFAQGLTPHDWLERHHDLRHP